MTSLLYGFSKKQVCKFSRPVAAASAAFIVSGCAVAVPAADNVPTGQDIFLGIIAFFLFLGVLLYAAFEAFNRLNRPMDEANKTELQARTAAFIIGILITIIVIAADSDTRTFLSISGILQLFPWFLLTLLGFSFGFAMAGVSLAASKYRPTSGYEFVLLVLTACGGIGLYLAFTAGGFRDNVLAGISSILVGLLSFRMLFPAGSRSNPIQKESRV